MPELFPILRVLADRSSMSTRFLVLGSASPELKNNASESLAGRIEFVDLTGFGMEEVGVDNLDRLWIRGGFPPSYLAETDADSFAWREGFVRTFLERDLPMFGVRVPPPTMRRFWTMLAHYHGRTWNASEIGKSLGLSDKTMRSYLDTLTETYMIRQLQPWFENVGKRQVKAPKLYLRDSGLLHSLLVLRDRHELTGHPKVGASWEGFALEQVLNVVDTPQAFFWSVHAGAEVDLLLFDSGKRVGIELKYSETPAVTRSMRSAVEALHLDTIWIVTPGNTRYPLETGITVCGLSSFPVEWRKSRLVDQEK
jgi:predicted AAA+ superfamily ATPase